MSFCSKKSLTALQVISKYAQIRRLTKTISSMNVAAPQPNEQPKTFSPKVEEIANSIAKLNLLEVADLSDLLKKKLNLPDAPVMSLGSFSGAVAATKEEEEQAPASEQINFSVELRKIDEKQKVPLIKEIKALLEGVNLVQAKKFVESAPIMVKQNISKDEAEKIKEALTKLGAEVQIV